MRTAVSRACFAWLIALGAIGCTRDDTGLSANAVVGGEPAAGRFAPVGLVFDLSHIQPSFRCSGVLVDRDAVVTAAHCVLDLFADHVGFALGDDAHNVDPADIVPASALVPHPLFVGQGNGPVGIAQANDIGIIKLSRDLIDERLDLIGRDHVLQQNDAMFLVGAGRPTADGTTEAGVRRVGEVSAVAVGAFEFEFSRDSEPQACEGDSGGALIVEQAGKRRLVGLVSRDDNPFDADCSSGAIATRLSSYIDFLEQNNVVACGNDCGPDPVPDGAVDSDGGNPGDSSVTDRGSSVVSPPVGSGLTPRRDSGCGVGGAAHDGFLWVPLLLVLVLLPFLLRRRSC